MGRKRRKEHINTDFVVISYLEGERRVHKTSASSYREAKRLVARELRESLGLWDTNLADIQSKGLMVARRASLGGG